MTIHEIANQIHFLTDGYVNSVKFSKAELEQAIRKWMRAPLAIKDTYVVELRLPDGNWLAEITRFADSPDGYDYYIPDTREQEDLIWHKLGVKTGGRKTV